MNVCGQLSESINQTLHRFLVGVCILLEYFTFHKQVKSGTVDPRLSESRLSDTSIIRIRKFESHNRN